MCRYVCAVKLCAVKIFLYHPLPNSSNPLPSSSRTCCAFTVPAPSPHKIYRLLPALLAGPIEL